MAFKGACCCGALRIEATGEPTLNAICHCDNCKRRTGSAFGWSVYFREDEVTIDGEFAIYAFDGKAGHAERGFCPKCGSTLFWRSPGAIGLAGGVLAPDGLPEPSISASEDSRCAWVEIPQTWARMP